MTASTRITSGAPSHCTSSPPSAGPATCADGAHRLQFGVALDRFLAGPRGVAGSSGRRRRRTPWRHRERPDASTSGNVSAPARHASGTEPAVRRAPTSPEISTLRLRIRSTPAPQGSPTTRNAAVSHAASRPTSNSSARGPGRPGAATRSCDLRADLADRVADQSCRKSRPAGWPTRLVRYQRGGRDAAVGSAGITQVMFANRLGKVNQLPSQRYRELVDPSDLGRRPATDAEAKALASSLRLRILRMCLDEPMTNAQLAERLGRPPASVLHHVRTLTATGFLEALPVRRAPAGRGRSRTPSRAQVVDAGGPPGRAGR